MNFKDDNSYFLLLLHDIDLMRLFDVALLESCKAMNVRTWQLKFLKSYW